MQTFLLMAAFLGAAALADAQVECVNCRMAPAYAASAVTYMAPSMGYGSSGATAVRSYGSAGATAVMASNGSAGGTTEYRHVTTYRRGLFGRLRPIRSLAPVASVSVVQPMVVSYRPAVVQEYVPTAAVEVPATVAQGAKSELQLLDERIEECEKARDRLSATIDAAYSRRADLERQASPAAPSEDTQAYVRASLRGAPRAPTDLPAASLADSPKAPSQYLVASL